MFKDLKSKLATQVNKTNQALFSTILPTDTNSTRSRTDSTASDISQRTYISPPRSHPPPSDIESEYGGDDSDYERNPKTQQLLTIYKNKYIQLKKAYDEIEHEKDHVKTILQDYQDLSIQRQSKLREQLKNERKMKDEKIETLTEQLNTTQEDKYIELLKERDELLQRISSIEIDVNWKEQYEELQKKYTDQSHQELDEQKMINENLQMTLLKLQQDYTQLNSQLIDRSAFESELKTKLEEDFAQSSAEKQSEFEKQLAEKDNDILQLKDSLSSINEQTQQTINTLQLAHAEDRQLLDEKNKEIDEKTRLISKLESEIQSQKSSFEQEINTLHQQNQQIELDSYRDEIVSLKKINEEQIVRIEKLIEEKDDDQRRFNEQNEKIEQLEISLKQTQESSGKLRKALQNLKETMSTNEQTQNTDTVRLKEHEIDYNNKLKAMAKEMSLQIDDKEREYHQQLNEFINHHQKTENDLKFETEQRINNAEQRALFAEGHCSKMQEELKGIQLDHYRVVQDLRQQIQRLIKEQIQTIDNSSQTRIEDLIIDDPHLFTFEPTEIDYLKQIILAYMTGTDRLTMAKVICAVLRYDEEQKSLIIEHEKLRHSRWIKSSR